MPSQAAQVAMMRKAYREAGIDPRETCYVEAHGMYFTVRLTNEVLTRIPGTGTKVGDKIESAAIAEVFCPDRSETSPLYVGSVKTNIGHLESTAGLAGVLKTVLMLEKGMIPPNLNFSHASDTIPLEALHINVCISASLPIPS
jgi:emericellamide synthase (highly reducing iterative type I polyketide synthase)